ncbi:hypothetical protein ACFFV7_04880 [Nonomuraea spiralis]|uniref:Uncharacterized protein n=1 Tax=Nonomuraea spiralis TaxID=46182 RepID=A0ABV5I7L1_9ACTN|nr:hypothetical protein [Nonomuraea spiralis]GGT09707.1 hypothetical protein GCM10010176_062690 [Nonomuraea spiralis]
MRKSLMVLNVVAAAGAMASSVVALVDPSVILPAGAEVSGGLSLYAQAYAARALPLGAALLWAMTANGRPALVPLLVASGVVQVADIAIGLTQGVPGMAVGGTIAAAVHLSTAWALTRRARTAPATA